MDCLIELSKYLYSLPGAKMSEKIGVIDIDEILLISLPKSLSKQEFVQGFDYEYTTLENSVDMFEHIDISESSCEGLV